MNAKKNPKASNYLNWTTKELWIEESNFKIQAIILMESFHELVISKELFFTPLQTSEVQNIDKAFVTFVTFVTKMIVPQN